MENFAKIVFEAVGSHQDPKSQRAEFAAFFNTYMAVCEKKEEWAAFSLGMQDIFEHFDGVMVSMDCYDDDCYMVDYVDPIEAESLVEGVISRFKFKNVLYNMTDHKDCFTLTPEMVQQVYKALFSPEEDIIYTMVNEYEKNLINSHLDTVEARKTHKI